MMDNRDNSQSMTFDIRGWWQKALAALLLFAMGFALWAWLAPLHSAVIANGFVRVEGNRQRVQHFDGGLIDKLLVSEGNWVNKNAPLIELKTAALQQSLNTQMLNYLQLSAQRGRLLAQAQGRTDIHYGPDITQLAKRLNSLHYLNEQKELLQRHHLRQQQQLAIIDSQTQQVTIALDGDQRTLTSLASQQNIIKREIKALSQLVDRRLVSEKQLADTRFQAIALATRMDEVKTTQRARQQRLNELAISRKQITTQTTVTNLEALDRIHQQLPTLKKNIELLKERMARAVLKAPVSGYVTQLQFNTVGATIAPGDTVLEIVPDNEHLIIEAHIKPSDVENLKPGTTAQVRLTAYNTRHAKPITGQIQLLSPDRHMDPQGRPYYMATIAVTAEAWGTLTPYPGMPAEVIINNGQRTLLDYLLKPIWSGAARSLREN